VPQSITVEDSMSMVHASAGRNPPASEHLLSEPAIVARMAQATLPGSRVPWAWLTQDYNRIRDKIAQVFDAFENFNDRVRVPGGFRLRNLASERVWATPSGRAQFRVHALPDAAPCADDELILSTIRSHDQYNTTVYGFDDRYRGVKGHRRVVFIGTQDLARLGLSAGEWVDITSEHAGQRRTVQRFLLVEYNIPPGCIASYYPETNPLVPLQTVATGAGTPASKSVRVRLSRSRAGA
jgi:anaerobic selenocysteine-containing dehydrogenase